jgi:hypothetical protein
VTALDETTMVCVLGMSRTGTSLTTRVLNLLGVYLGPEDVLLGARTANPDGFWEHYRLMRLNEGILRRMGGNWREPPALPDGWEAATELEEERTQARELLDETFAGHELAGWKDPRNSLTLPFWQQLIPDMRYVICLRNPVDVAASLDRRDGISATTAFQLWLRYLASALVHTASRPRVFVSYESFFDDWHEPVARLAGLIGREPDAEPIQETIRDNLWHHRTAPDEVVADPRLPGDVRSLYVLSELLHDGRAESSPELVEAYARELLAGPEASPERTAQAERRELERRVKELHIELEKLR